MALDFRPEEYQNDATGNLKLFNLANTIHRDGFQSDEDVDKFVALISQDLRTFGIASSALPSLRLPGVGTALA